MLKSHVKRKYGISLVEYDVIVASPCQICGSDDLPRQLDHDHDTGNIRGALCGKCNRAIGLLDDSVPRVEAAVRYLREYNGSQES